MKEVLQTALDCRAIPDQLPSTYLTRHRNEGVRGRLWLAIGKEKIR
jgi:hypothetical protein